MAIANTLEKCLAELGVEHTVVNHPRAMSSTFTAAAAHVPGDCLAKSVLIEDEDGYLMVVVPSTHRVDLGRMHVQLGRLVGLATEEEVAQVFGDCARGAIPPVGFLYGIETVVDEALTEKAEIWFEAGDHERLIHMSTAEFQRLLGDTPRMRLSHHV